MKKIVAIIFTVVIMLFAVACTLDRTIPGNVNKEQTEKETEKEMKKEGYEIVEPISDGGSFDSTI